MKKKILLVLAWLLLSGNLYAQDKTPAFPTAEGYGKWATGGRGGKVVEVTTLEDTDRLGNPVEGSFRWALKQYAGEPITIVFRVSGIIDLKGREIRSKRNDITIAGQTAPGDGICIKGGSLNLGGSFNVIIRHMRFRLGLLNETGFIEGNSIAYENGGNFIIDHCSVSWSAEENTGFYDDKDLTVQWCLIAEGLYNAGHGKGARGYGSVWGGSTATYHHNLMAHTASRSPRFGTSTKNDIHVLIDYVNNVNYNWGKKNACYGGENELGAYGSVSINFVNNYYKPGPAYPGTSRSSLVRASYEPGAQGTHFSKWHLSGNYIEGTANTAINTNNYAGLEIEEYTDRMPGVTINDLKADHFTVAQPVNTQTASEAYQSVLKNAGAFPRDAVDLRIIEEVRTGTASAKSSFKGYDVTGIVDKPTDSGGYPTYNTFNITEDNDHDGIADYWELANEMDPTDSEDRNTLSEEGYTKLEVYLHGLAGEHITGFNYPEPVLTSSENESEIIQRRASVYLEDEGRSLAIQSQEPVLSVVLYDMNGRKASHFSGSNITSVDISSLPKGLYVAQIGTKSFVQRLKFLKY